MNKCIDCQNENLCKGNLRKGSHAHCFHPKVKYTHFIYVQAYSIITNNDETYVFGVETKDIFHTMGEIMYRFETQVKRITYVELTLDNIQTKLDFFQKNNIKIRRWIDRYNKEV